MCYVSCFDEMPIFEKFTFDSAGFYRFSGDTVSEDVVLTESIFKEEDFPLTFGMTYSRKLFTQQRRASTSSVTSMHVASM